MNNGITAWFTKKFKTDVLKKKQKGNVINLQFVANTADVCKQMVAGLYN